MEAAAGAVITAAAWFACSALCAALLLALERTLMGDLLRLEDAVRAAARPLYTLRLCALPLLFLHCFRCSFLGHHLKLLLCL